MKTMIATLFISLLVLAGSPTLSKANATSAVAPTSSCDPCGTHRVEGHDYNLHTVYFYPGHVHINLTGDGDTDLDLYVHDSPDARLHVARDAAMTRRWVSISIAAVRSRSKSKTWDTCTTPIGYGSVRVRALLVRRLKRKATGSETVALYTVTEKAHADADSLRRRDLLSSAAATSKGGHYLNVLRRRFCCFQFQKRGISSAQGALLGPPGIIHHADTFTFQSADFSGYLQQSVRFSV